MKDDLKIIIGYIKDFFSKKKLILIVVGLFTIIGLLTVILDPKEYVSSTSFIAQTNSDSGVGSGLKNIASIIGVNIGSNKEQKDIPVYLYPKLMASLSYNRELLNTKVTLRGESNPITLQEYYVGYRKKSFTDKLKKYTLGLPRVLMSSLRGQKKTNYSTKIDSLNYISIAEVGLLKKLSEDMVFRIDEFDGSIEIKAIMQDPIVAAQTTESAKRILQKKIINFRLGKAQERYDFVNEQHAVKREEYLDAQSQLAYYVDRNRFNNTESSSLRRKQLENKMNLAYIVFSDLESKRLAEDLNLKEDTPVFSPIQKSIVSNQSINPNPLVKILKFIAIGFIIAVFIHVIALLYRDSKNLWEES